MEVPFKHAPHYALDEHDLRRPLVKEMHLRSWPPFDAPCHVVQLVRLVDRDYEFASDARLNKVVSGPLQLGARHTNGELTGGVHFTCERHNEATTTTLFSLSGTDELEWDIHRVTSLREPLQWACSLPGKVMRATHILICRDEAEAEALLPSIGFSRQELVSCYIGGSEKTRGARIWSDFRIHENDFGLTLMAANDLPREELSRWAQRLQELGNYRNLALLGLPLAREGWDRLDATEEGLASLARNVLEASADDTVILDEITTLTMRLARDSASIDYRMDATEAYGAIVLDRLADLNVGKVSGFQSLVDFTQRRLLPALRTCQAHRRRSAQLEQRLQEFAALLRTRVETRIERQNAMVLVSMERNSERQLRLQQLVEGLSVVAISYYAIGILEHFATSIRNVFDLDLHYGVSASAPLVFVIVWMLIRRAKSRLET
ncbi:DUF3422 domain-containing protein [Novosphingobium sp. MW5]|nr:DUF3422 domain-containing protein [Novosphingobium sp. MW5]